MKQRSAFLLVCALVFASAPVLAAGKTYEVSYPASKKPGELPMGVTYTVWLPAGSAKLRGVIVHQHGCGTGACKGGATAAYDLHWQALAKKWNCALLGPSYHQGEKQDCRLWCDPRNGSAKTFLAALHDLAGKSGRPELETVPWCLWGHSGGGFWASLLQTLYPERIVAVWFRSGTAFLAWEKGDIKKPPISQEVYRIPIVCNPGAKERTDKRFKGAWDGAMAMFQAYRAKGAPAAFAADPRTSHECGDSRCLAIPFFDACLAVRLPEVGSASTKLRPVDLSAGWLADVTGEQAVRAADYHGKRAEAVWLPGERVARAWQAYVKKGNTPDETPPPGPFALEAVRRPDGVVELTWDAEADLDSGLAGFLIQRDGKTIGKLPEKPVGRFGRPLFQTMSYHDTPEKPLPAMRFIDRTAPAGGKPVYTVVAVNGVGLHSAPSKPARP